MVSYDPKDLLISLHIPKCGGTSFEKILKKWFGMGLHYHYANHEKSKAPQRVKFNLMVKGILPVAIHGHFDKETDGFGVFDYYPNAAQFVTIVRDPLELQLSYYFYYKSLVESGGAYWKGKKVTDITFLGKDVNEHLEIAYYNWLRFFPWELTAENFKKIFDEKFIHVGVTENLQKSIDIFSEKLGKKSLPVTVENVAHRDEKPSESSIRIFKEKHKLDYLIYDYAVSLNR